MVGALDFYVTCSIYDYAPFRSIVRSESAIKKSLVDQQTPQPVPASQGGGGQSLWQRMLKLTSELTQSKMKDVTGGAARSVQSIVGNKNDNTNSNNNIYKTDVTKDSSNKNTANAYNNINGVNTNSYYGNSLYATPTPLYYSGASMDDPEVRDLHFRRLKEYWDAYYKRYYESLGPGKLPDWMSRSPWSNDPERVQGALDKDVVGNGDQPNSTTSLQNWNSYFQDYFAYPSPPSSYTNTTDIDNSTNSRPNSSSDAFIENVIENDLEARNISDKTINRDLYYEDQLIHTEEKLRPRLNATRYKTTQRVTATTQKTTGRPSTSKQSTTPSAVADYYKTTPYQALQNSSSTTPSSGSASYNGGYGGVSYNASEYMQAVTQDRKVATQYDSSTTKDNRATTTAQDSQASTGSQSSPLGSSAQANRTSDAYADYYKNYYKSQSGSYPNSQTISPYNTSASGGSNAATAESSGKQQATSTDNGITDRVNALLKQAKASRNSSTESHKDPDSSANVYDVSSQPQAFVSDEEPDDDNDYLDQLDISALVRQLIKLETIRKQKQMLRRKKIQRANSKAVANLIVGDLFQGYFKNKKVKSQKALKKHLLHKGRRLIRPKANDSPLPKFT